MVHSATYRLTRLEDLVDPSNAYPIGSVVSMTFTDAVIVTNDYQVEQAGGMPRNCFLLAAPQEDENLREVVLLRVESVAPLSVQRDFAAVREDLALSGRTAPLDARTQANLESLGLSCKVVGTFHLTDEGPRFGADMDRVRGNASYRVVKPHGRALGIIGSYARPSQGDTGLALSLGVVRYTETQASPDSDAHVFVDLNDFLAKKSAVLGQSRSGKSNTMKIICQKTFEHGRVTGKKTGQIIFDPQGEYANATKQDVALEDDPSALANVGNEDEVRIYKMLRDNENESGKLRHLQLNLMDEDNVEFMWSLMLRNLSSGASAGTNYIASLESQKFYRPGPKASQEKKELWDRQLLGVYGLVGASLADVHALKRPLDLFLSDHAVEVIQHVDHLTHGRTDEHVLVENTDDAYAVLEFLVDNEDRLNKSIRKELKKGILTPFKEQILAQREGRNGVVAAFRRVMPFHNPRARGDVREKIWQDMRAGRLVMVDLSKGNPRTVTSLSELIASYLITQSADNFTAGNDNVHYQVVVEEAHNLFGNTESEEYTPWVRISKEGAKYGIGLVYATQEVTGVDHRILSNTSNFIVSHLSSTIETNALAKYYAFGDWADHLMRVETKGFVRLKTESSPYIVPVQVEKFEVLTKTVKPRADLEAEPDVPKTVEPAQTYSEEDYNALF